MYSHVLTSVLKIHSCRVIAGTVLLLLAAISNNVLLQSTGLDSMSSIAISYGENGPVFCGLKSDGSHLVSCYGSNSAIIYGTPAHFPFQGISAGDGFVCGLLVKSNQPYCWGNNNYIQMGVPQPMTKGAQYSEISAGDNHLCGLRTETTLEKNTSSNSFVDCWGYNMTSNMVFEGEIMSISAGSEFNCALFSHNRSVLCWGDETSSRVISLIPKNTRFKTIAAGGYHVCGIQEGVDSRVLCWGRSLDMEEELVSVRRKGNNIDQAPAYPMLSVVGGKFHACGIRSFDRGIVCWGFQVAKSSTPPPNAMKMYVIAAGDYFTCGVVDKSLSPVCWGSGFPSSIPMAVSPGLCKSKPCNPGFYEFNSPSGVACSSSSSRRPDSRICLPCSNPCDMHPRGACSTDSSVDHDGREHCVLNCTGCASSECFFSNCSSGDPSTSVEPEKKARRFWAIQLPAIVAEACFAVFWVCVVCLTAGLYVRHKLRHCSCSTLPKQPIINQKSENYKEMKLLEDHQQQLKKMSRAQQFTYEELQRATGGFKEESIVGKGSFSCVFKGVLKDGTAVAVKRAILSSDMKKNSKEFHTELDLLSRLNHAHLLNLLGYCEEGGERLLVYEFMAHGSLHQHLHGNKNKEQLDWVRRVTIAVQAARGIEYLHGYACPPVIHRDIKSSNILIDEEHNARVSDFGLSLLGPTDSSSPLAELPAGTLGYLDPEYYRLHYLTTKSDVYSFGVLLLEILSGRKAIDMQFEEGNIVQWAVPLIKSGDISAILDPVLKPPADLEALIRIANVACKCVRMRGKDRPSMEKVTTALERALALLMGTPCSEQPILPTEVVLGSSRMHKKSSQRSSNRSSEDVTTSADHDFQRFEFRAPSWITFPSVASSQRRKSSVSDADLEVRNCAAAAAAGGDTRNPASTERNNGSSNNNCTEGLRSLEEEIGPASPQQNLFLKHNF